MVFFNHATRQMTVKIVYYGPGLCGKTTNLNTIYNRTSHKARGEMVSLNTETDRTLFFDLLPMDVGMVGGFRTKLQLYTVPGQVFYNSTRKLVLKGVDGIVFVVDSQAPMLDACRESYKNLDENLRELGLNMESIPMVFQWNKRDLRNVMPMEELEASFNPHGIPSFQSVASDGTGVFETLRGITKLALSHIKTHVLGDSQAVSAPALADPAVPDGFGGALTLSDLPSVTEFLEGDGPFPGSADGASPLPDGDEDTGFYIEAPMLPEPPEPDTAAADDDLAFIQRIGHALPVAEETVTAPVSSIPVEAPSLEPVAKAEAKADPPMPLSSPKVDGKRPAAKTKAASSKDSINSLLGELTQVGRSGALSVLRMEVPPEVDGQDIEVVVQLRSKGQILVEGQIQRPAPGKGSIAKLSVELKRS